MKSLVTLPAHFNGSTIVIDTPHNLKRNTKLLVTVLDFEIEGEERNFWTELSLSQLEKAYGKDEPEYPLSLIKEPNPGYNK